MTEYPKLKYDIESEYYEFSRQNNQERSYQAPIISYPKQLFNDKVKLDTLIFKCEYLMGFKTKYFTVNRTEAKPNFEHLSSYIQAILSHG